MKTFKTKSSVLVASILAVAMCSCTGGLKNNEFRLKGTFAGLTENHLVTLEYFTAEDMITDTIPHETDGFNVVLTMKETSPAYVTLVIRDVSQMSEAMILISPPIFNFFASPQSTITLQGHVEHMNLTKVSGGEYNKDLAALNVLLYDANAQMNRLHHAINKANNEADEETLTALAAEYETVKEKMMHIETQFITNNLNSPFAAFLYTQTIPLKSLEELQQDFAKFGKTARRSPFGHKIEAAIESAKATAIGVTAPNFTQIDRDGNSVSLSDYRGKYVILSFWGSWCGPCRKGNPDLIQLYNTYKNESFDILGLAGNERNRDRWLEAIEQDNLPWRQINLMENDDKHSLLNLYNVKAFPTKLLLDPEGRILAYCVGGYDEITTLLQDIFGR
ncbi:MAG: AhpC/TSA family protein [Bacteroidales bacterium]|nr:AhpC/TSA family protein [Bacteroidales bacterium]